MMKKHVLIGSVLLAAISAFSQTGKVKPKPSGIFDTRILANSKFTGVESVGSNPTTSAPVTNESGQSASKTAVNNTWNNFTASHNIYGTIISYAKPLQWNDELNTVSFIHRKSPTYSFSPPNIPTAASGGIVAMISQNCGADWDSTGIYSNDAYWGRYPGGAIYNPPTNTVINNAYVVAAGPTTGPGAVTWIGNFYASKQLGAANYDNVASTVPNAQQAFPTTGPYTANLGRQDFAMYSFSATDDGKMRNLGGILDEALNQDTGVVLVTGTFNNGVFDWAGTNFHPPVTTAPSDGSPNWLSRPMMAWNESGTHGYVIVIGSRLGATGANVGFQPIVWKTTNSGATWSLEPGIDFNNVAFKDVRRPIITVASDSTLEVPFFWWIEGMDCTVDKNNKLHVFSSIVGTFSNHPDSLGFTAVFGTEGYRWQHLPSFRPYLYDFIYDGVSNWSHITIDSMSSEGPSGTSTGNGYQDNPWDPDPSNSNSKTRVDARLQMSRTPGGEYIVYTWAESDTTVTTQQKKWNSLPNVKARVLNVNTGVVHPTELNVTGKADGISGTPNGNVNNRAMYHFTSPKCRVASTSTVNGPALSLPMTVSNSNPYSQLTGNTHWFSWATLNFGNIPDANIVLCGSISTPTTPTDTTGMAENALSSASSSYLFPNPAKNNATLNITLEKMSKVQIEVMNTVGQVVKSTQVSGQMGENKVNIELSGLASGIYMVNIKVDNASSTKKLIIE